jgi:hypothetical protein
LPVFDLGDVLEFGAQPRNASECASIFEVLLIAVGVAVRVSVVGTYSSRPLSTAQNAIDHRFTLTQGLRRGIFVWNQRALTHRN